MNTITIKTSRRDWLLDKVSRGSYRLTGNKRLHNRRSFNRLSTEQLEAKLRTLKKLESKYIDSYVDYLHTVRAAS